MNTYDGSFSAANPPVSERSGRRGNLTVTTFNVQNLFDLLTEPGKLDRRTVPSPLEFEVKLEKLSRAVMQELLCPELIIVQEIDNETVLQELGDRVNGIAGTQYSAVSYETSDLRSIEVGFLYDGRRIALLESYQLSGEDVERAFGGISPSPGREPIAGLFRAHGTDFTVIGNHFKSRGGFILDTEERLAMEKATEDQRRDQALVVRRFVNRLFEADPGALVAVAGDFNDFHYLEPEPPDGRPLTLLQGSGDEVRLIDVTNRIPEKERYTFVHYGAAHVLDHIFISPGLEKKTVGTDILHFNAGFHPANATDISTPIRSSDHDPVELRLRL